MSFSRFSAGLRDLPCLACAGGNAPLSAAAAAASPPAPAPTPTRAGVTSRPVRPKQEEPEEADTLRQAAVTPGWTSRRARRASAAGPPLHLPSPAVINGSLTVIKDILQHCGVLAWSPPVHPIILGSKKTRGIHKVI